MARRLCPAFSAATQTEPRGVVGFEVDPRCLLAAVDRGDGASIAVGVEQRHGSFGEVAAVAGLPLVVHVGQDGADEADHGGGVGEDPDDAGSALDLLVDPLERVGGPDLRPVRARERGEGQRPRPSPRPSAARSWGTTWRAGRGPRPRSPRPRRRRAGRRSVRNTAATMSAWVLGTWASRLRAKWTRQRWCAGALEGPLERLDQAGVLVADDQPHPAQAALLQRGQEAAPEHLVLAVADVEAEDLPDAVGGDPGGHHHRHRHHLGGGVADVEVGRVEVDVGELGVVQRPGPERADRPRPGRRRSARPRTWRSPSRRPAPRPGRRRCGSRRRGRRPPSPPRTAPGRCGGGARG